MGIDFFPLTLFLSLDMSRSVSAGRMRRRGDKVADFVSLIDLAPSQLVIHMFLLHSADMSPIFLSHCSFHNQGNQNYPVDTSLT